MLSWSSQPLEALSLILNHTLKLPLTAVTIGEGFTHIQTHTHNYTFVAQMDAALATFLVPDRASLHKDGVFNLARRYFFLLFR